MDELQSKCLPYLPLGMKETRYGNMIFMPHDCFVGQSIVHLGEFSQGEAQLIEQCLQPGMTVLDVGAHIGGLTLPMARAVGPTGKVLAFEPQVVLFILLCANLAINGATMVSCYRAALSNKSGRIKMPKVAYELAANFGAFGEELMVEADAIANKSDDIIPMLTIDQLNLSACHFMKVDVEGMEKKVLEGAKATIEKFRPTMLIENDRRARARELVGYIEDLNYTAYWHTPLLFNKDNFAKNAFDPFDKIVSLDVFCVPNELEAVVANGTRCTVENAIHPGCCQD